MSTDAVPSREVLKLDLIHLGTTIRTMTAHADPADFGTLERLMRDAIRRAGGDLSQIGEYEMAIHRIGGTEPLATLVLVE